MRAAAAAAVAGSRFRRVNGVRGFICLRKPWMRTRPMLSFAKQNASRCRFDHIADPIYRRLMRDFIQGAQMPEVKIAALRDLSGRIKSLDETGINYSIIDGLQRSWCYSTTVLLALHREKLVSDRCITVEAWDYFRPFIEKLGDPDTAARTLLGRTIRYEIYYNIDLEGLLHYMVTFNTAQRRMSLQVQLEIMRKPLIDEIEAAANIKVFRDTHDIEATGKMQKPRDQFAASDIAVAAEAFITNNAQTSQKEVAEDLLEKDSGYTATGVDVGDIADVVYMLKRVAQDIHPLMLLVYADEPGKKFYFSGGGTFLTGFTAACGYVRNRNNMKMLEGALEKLILLLKQPSEDPLGLEEYQELIKNITSSRGKMMRRLVYDTYPALLLRHHNQAGVDRCLPLPEPDLKGEFHGKFHGSRRTSQCSRSRLRRASCRDGTGRLLPANHRR